MKKILTLSLLAAIYISCEQKKETTPVTEKVDYAVFGDSISSENALSNTEMMEKFATLKEGDTLEVKFKSGINEVCQKKGCWMTLSMPNETDMMVRFKDYGFFVPLDATGEVVINGKAYVSETSLEELKHYAEDAGKSSEEIAMIDKAEKTFSFEANGVLLKQ